jgi:D-alanyl-lipoteichoic acid acyltransferase DltB (MBOAT superfamily)
MIVPSFNFLLFAAVAALVFNLSTAVWWRRAVFLAVNIIFLTTFSHDPLTFLPFAGFLALGFVAQHLTRNGSAPRLFVAFLVILIAAFFWLKRYAFVPSGLFLPFPYLLIGLSYVFFRVLQLVIDRHQDAIEGPVGPVSYLNYTLNFTSLTSGPIQRYQDYHEMETTCLPLDLVVAGNAFERIVVGFFKVAIVSMLLSLAHHQSIDALGNSQTLADRFFRGIVVAAGYPIYLYFNFSGYTDVVIGVARFFRVVLPENFDRPFSAESVLIFWNRWHMTLSGWLKAYVYNPLMVAGMTRITAPKLAPYISVVVFFMTFFLVGLWHGQTTEFFFYGFLTGGGLAVNKLYQVVMQDLLGRQGYRALAANPLYRAIGRGLNFTWFTFTLFWFWSSWGQIAGFSHALGATTLWLGWLAIFTLATVVLSVMDAMRTLVLRGTRSDAPIIQSRYLRTAFVTALSIITVAVTVLLDSPAPEIVYKTF